MPSTAHTTQPENLNLRARAAHLAIAAQVDLQGSDLARVLYAAAKHFNAEYFDGALLPCVVEITPPGSIRALADYRARSAEGLESAIRVGHHVASRGTRYALDVLLHEMVHAYCFEVLEDLEPGYGAHGPKWTAQCNRIGRMLGLPEVFTKGRGGPNSARWPLCVRPGDYYEPEEPKPERRVRETAGEPKARTRSKGKAVPPIEQIADLLPALTRPELEALRDIVLGMLGQD